MVRLIDVEISPTCNLRCPNCLVKNRLHVPFDLRREDENLVRHIIDRVPKDSVLLFIGLGEPSMPKSQERIAEILGSRKDLRGFMQTNGSFELNSDLVNLIGEERLHVGLSYDNHHERGGMRELRIQKDLVWGLSIIVEEGIDFNIGYIKKNFVNLKRILLDPFYDVDAKIITPWKYFRDFVSRFSREFERFVVYAEVYPLEGCEVSLRYLEAFAGEEFRRVKDNWYFHEEGRFLLNVGYFENRDVVRILVDGTVVDNLVDVMEDWDYIDNKYGEKFHISRFDFGVED